MCHCWFSFNPSPPPPAQNSVPTLHVHVCKRWQAGQGLETRLLLSCLESVIALSTKVVQQRYRMFPALLVSDHAVTSWPNPSWYTMCLGVSGVALFVNMGHQGTAPGFEHRIMIVDIRMKISPGLQCKFSDED